MDDLDLPDDLKDDVEVVYLGEDEVIEGMDDFDEEAPEEEEDDGIEVQVVDMAKSTFSKHRGSVFMCALSGCRTMAITGGEDDMAYLWNVDDGEVLLECTGHKDSVTEVGFNHNDQYVVTGDMGGLIQVWNVKEKKLTWCYEGDDLSWLFWHHMTDALVSGTQAGDVYIFQIPQGNCKVLPSQGSPTNCGRLLPDGKRLAVGYADGQIKLWDIKGASVLWQYNDPQMNGVNSLRISDDGLLLCASPTGAIVKATDGKLLSSLLPDGESEIEASAFNSELGIVATGALSGQICVWDVGRRVLRHQAKIECSVTCVEFGKNGRLFVGASDGAIYMCDARSGSLVETLTGHEGGVLSMVVCRDGDFVLSTSDDGTAKIFAVASA